MIHQYIHRVTGEIRTEPLIKDGFVNFIYSSLREKSPRLFQAATSARFTALLGYANFDSPILSSLSGAKRFVKELGIDMSECMLTPSEYKTPRDLFERQICFWKYRYMEEDEDTVVSPADAKMVAGSLEETSHLFIKDKFFSFEEMLGSGKGEYLEAFQGGDFAIFRLTPEKYHYNHTPVSGVVADIYTLDGRFNSCNPKAVVAEATPYSKNRRVVTIIDTDVEGGSNVGLIAMIEIVAMMIGDIKQCYSEEKYENPCDVAKGLFMKKGQPKSLYRPGSSTDVLFFQKGRIDFCQDIMENMKNKNVISRFSLGFGQPLVETDLNLRSTIAYRRETK